MVNANESWCWNWRHCDILKFHIVRTTNPESSELYCLAWWKVLIRVIRVVHVSMHFDRGLHVDFGLDAPAHLTVDWAENLRGRFYHRQSLLLSSYYFFLKQNIQSLTLYNNFGCRIRIKTTRFRTGIAWTSLNWLQFTNSFDFGRWVFYYLMHLVRFSNETVSIGYRIYEMRSNDGLQFKAWHFITILAVAFE